MAPAPAMAASRLLRAASSASLASRASAAAATRAAAMASRSARAARAAAAAASSRAATRLDGSSSGVVSPPPPLIRSCPPTRDGDGGSTKKARDDAPRPPPLCRTSSSAADDRAQCSESDDDDDGITPTNKDMESDEAIWALYERWCKVFNKKRDHAEMSRRFKLFKHYAQHVHHWNTHVTEDPKKAAACRRKRRQAKLLSKDQDVSHIAPKYLPMVLYKDADGRDPFLCKYDKRLLKEIEENEAHCAVVGHYATVY